MRSVRPGSGTFSRRREARGLSDHRLRISALVTGGALAAAVAVAGVFPGQNVSSYGTGARLEPPVAQALRLRGPEPTASDQLRAETRVSGPSPLTFVATVPVPARDGVSPAPPRLSAAAVPLLDAVVPSSWSVSPPPGAGGGPGTPSPAAHDALAPGYSPVPDALLVVRRAPAVPATSSRKPEQVVYEMGGPAELKPSFRLICDACPGLHYAVNWAQHWLQHRPIPRSSSSYSQQEAIIVNAASAGLIVVQKGGQMNLAEWNF